MVRITARNARMLMGAARRARRARLPRRYRGKRTNLKGFTRTQTNSILRTLGRNDETKYYAKDLLVNQALDAAIHSPGTDMVPLVPAVPPGTQENQRIGRKITPTKCRVDLNLAFRQPQIGTEGLASEAYANQINVVVYVLRSKVYKNWYQYFNSTQYLRLLDNGDGTSTSFGYQVGTPAFWTADNRDLMKPIDTSEFTLVKKKIVRLTKNVGLVDIGASTSTPNASVPNLHTSSYRGSISYKLPQLQWDDTNTDMNGYPTNANVFLAIGYCYADNNGTYWFTGGNPSAADDILSVTARNHVWYKDA